MNLDFFPLTTTGPGETALQTTSAMRLVALCKMKVAEFVGQADSTFPPRGTMAGAGRVSYSMM